MVSYINSSDAATVINGVAAEVGLTPVADPYQSADASFIQMTYLLNTAGKELSVMRSWNVLRREHTFTTAVVDTGDYALPVDFRRIYDRTAWDRTNDEPLVGPLSPQEWAALKGRDTPNISILSFRLMDGEFSVYPHNPVGVIRNVAYEYVSNYWVLNADGTTYQKEATTGTDIVVFDDLLIGRYLKLKFLIARGLDATAAQDDFNQIFDIIGSQEKGGRTLNAGRSHGTFPLINPIDNLGDTGYGS